MKSTISRTYRGRCGLRGTSIALATFPLGHEMPKMMQLGFSRITGMLAKPNRGKLEEIILAAVQWAGRATVEHRREEAFLLYMVALESLLCDTKVESIYRLSMRTARLLGNSLQERKDIRRKAKELYDTRSAIVHSGSLEATTADLAAIRLYAKKCIIAVLTDSRLSPITKKDQFYAWFEDQMLG